MEHLPLSDIGWICTAVIALIGLIQQVMTRRDRRNQVDGVRKHISSKIEENTEVSKRAFNEANNFNKKLREISDGQTRLIERISRIESDFVSGVRLEGHLEKIETLIDGRTKSMESIEQRLNSIESRLTKIEAKN